MKLYLTPHACSLAVDIVARELAIPLDLEWVDVRAKRLRDGSDYYKINPKGQVPTLELRDGQRLTEGPVIVQYLADQKPNSSLLAPAGTLERYRTLEWLNFISTELHKGFTPLFRPTTPLEYRADRAPEPAQPPAMARRAAGWSRLPDRPGFHRRRCLLLHHRDVDEAPRHRHRAVAPSQGVSRPRRGPHERDGRRTDRTPGKSRRLKRDRWKTRGCMKLYHEVRGCSLAVDIVARELEIPLDLIWVDVPNKRLPDGSDYYKINPKGQVPALELPNGQHLSEGAVIMQYLADQRPDRDLIAPAGTLERYRILEWMSFIASDLHKGAFMPLFRKTTPPEFASARPPAHRGPPAVARRSSGQPRFPGRADIHRGRCPLLHHRDVDEVPRHRRFALAPSESLSRAHRLASERAGSQGGRARRGPQDRRSDMTTSHRWKRRPEHSNWGDFGPDDQLGAMNLVGRAQVLKGLAEVRTGQTFSLSLPLDYPGGTALHPRRHPPRRFATLRGGKNEGEQCFCFALARDNPVYTDVYSDDLVVLHTQYSTQWDGLAHVGSLFDSQGDRDA